jgi:hypothetical protein
MPICRDVPFWANAPGAQIAATAVAAATAKRFFANAFRPIDNAL